MLPRAQLTPFYILSATLVLTCICFFTSSAIIWPYGSIGLTFLNLATLTLLIHIAWFIDPAMAELIEKRKQGHNQLPYIPGSGHVIENERCRICLIDAPKGTKHCRVCNICVQNFDHHCVWLNRCIGSKNYRNFLFLVISVVINTAIIWVYHLSMLAVWVSHGQIMAPIVSVEEKHQVIQLPLFSTTLYIWVGATMLVLFVGLVTFVPVLNLCFFHMRLLQKGKSTYMVIMESRGRNKNKATLTGGSQVSNLSEVKIAGSRVAPANWSLPALKMDSDPRATGDPPCPPRVLDTLSREDSPRYRAQSSNLPHDLP